MTKGIGLMTAALALVIASGLASAQGGRDGAGSGGRGGGASSGWRGGGGTPGVAGGWRGGGGTPGVAGGWRGGGGQQGWSGNRGSGTGKWSGNRGNWNRGSWHGHSSGYRHGGWYGGRGYWYGGYYGPRVWGGWPYSYPWYSTYAAPYPVYVEPPVAYAEAPPVYIERAPQYVPPAPPYAEPEPPAPAPVPVPDRVERFTLSATELFEFDRAVLRMPQPKLDEIAAVLIANPQIQSITITGYTDRIGTDSYNLKLSQRRAAAVKNYLVSKGVSAIRLTAIGRGKDNPVVHCTEKSQAALIKCLEPNRRVVIEPVTVERRVR